MAIENEESADRVATAGTAPGRCSASRRRGPLALAAACAFILAATADPAFGLRIGEYPDCGDLRSKEFWTNAGAGDDASAFRGEPVRRSHRSYVLRIAVSSAAKANAVASLRHAGVVRGALGCFDSTEKHLDSALKSDADSAALIIPKGHCRIARGDVEEGLRHWNRARRENGVRADLALAVHLDYSVDFDLAALHFGKSEYYQNIDNIIEFYKVVYAYLKGIPPESFPDYPDFRDRDRAHVFMSNTLLYDVTLRIAYLQGHATLMKYYMSLDRLDADRNGDYKTLRTLQVAKRRADACAAIPLNGPWAKQRHDFYTHLCRIYRETIIRFQQLEQRRLAAATQCSDPAICPAYNSVVKKLDNINARFIESVKKILSSPPPPLWRL